MHFSSQPAIVNVKRWKVKPLPPQLSLSMHVHVRLLALAEQKPFIEYSGTIQINIKTGTVSGAPRK